MNDDSEPKVTREGLFEELLGKTKEAAGELLGNEALAASGREQQAEAETVSPEPPGDDTEGG